MLINPKVGNSSMVMLKAMGLRERNDHENNKASRIPSTPNQQYKHD